MKDDLTYQCLAQCLSYPGQDVAVKVKACGRRLKTHYPTAVRPFLGFERFIETTPLFRLEEIYSHTFDIHAICYLDFGYLLFGEDYKRGALLVELKRLHRLAENDCAGELPDHLPNVLRLFPKMPGPKEREELAGKLVLPAMVRMLDGFGSGEQNTDDQFDKSPGVSYRLLIETVTEVLRSDFGNPRSFAIPPRFSGGVGHG